MPNVIAISSGKIPMSFNLVLIPMIITDELAAQAALRSRS
jgi:hypothetical protein